MSNLPNGGDPAVLATGKKSPVHMNHYDLAYKFAAPERFGEISPFLKYMGEPKDKNILLYSGSTVDSMSLHAPILQDIRKNKDFFQVPMKAILPHTWEYIQNLPTHGDDIDAVSANCLIFMKHEDYFNVLDSLQALVSDGSYLFTNGAKLNTYTESQFIKFMRFLVYFNSLFAKDSLFAAFRMPLANVLDPNDGKSVQDILDELWQFYHSFLDVMASYDTVDGEYSCEIDFMDSDNNVVLRHTYDFRNVEDRMAFYYDFIENSNVAFPSAASIADAYDEVAVTPDFPNLVLYLDSVDYQTSWPTLFNVPNALLPINIAPIIAYQLVCAEFWTDDKIDWIYSAEMYRQMFEAVAYQNNITFSYNDVYLPLDGFSTRTLDILLGAITTLSNYDLLVSLFTRKRSLRYKDYFCGARPQPLANGDDNFNIDVNDQVASVIDVTQSLQKARLRMAVNRVGRKAKNYLKGVFDSKERVRNDVPVKIGHIDETLYQVETQNTAADQLTLDNSRTSVLSSKNRKFGFETDCDESSIIIGVSSYEITRFYDAGFDPFGRKVDRFDMFNPFLQYIGDQPISQEELNAGLNHDDYFGYCNRNMEYKVNIDYCIGDFKDALSGWLFRQPLADRNTVIGPDFIRAKQTEIDKYYVALTGTTPTKRYHFICKYHNHLSADRNMVKAPQILG